MHILQSTYGVILKFGDKSSYEAAGAALGDPVRQNNLMSAANLVAGVQKSRTQLNQIGFHTVIQIGLESNAIRLNMLTWAESPTSLKLTPHCSPTGRCQEMGGAETEMNLHLNQLGSRTET